jgi:hypothetical protein
MTENLIMVGILCKNVGLKFTIARYIMYLSI